LDSFGRSHTRQEEMELFLKHYSNSLVVFVLENELSKLIERRSPLSNRLEESNFTDLRGNHNVAKTLICEVLIQV